MMMMNDRGHRRRQLIEDMMMMLMMMKVMADGYDINLGAPLYISSLAHAIQ